MSSIKQLQQQDQGEQEMSIIEPSHILASKQLGLDEQILQRLKTEVPNKIYQIKVPIDSKVYRRFKINNRDTFDKTLSVWTTDSQLIYIRSPKIFIKASQQNEIRIRLTGTQMRLKQNAKVYVQRYGTDILEEVILFEISVVNKEEFNERLSAVVKYKLPKKEAVIRHTPKQIDPQQEQEIETVGISTSTQKLQHTDTQTLLMRIFDQFQQSGKSPDDLLDDVLINKIFPDIPGVSQDDIIQLIIKLKEMQLQSEQQQDQTQQEYSQSWFQKQETNKLKQEEEQFKPNQNAW